MLSATSTSCGFQVVAVPFTDSVYLEKEDRGESAGPKGPTIASFDAFGSPAQWTSRRTSERVHISHASREPGIGTASTPAQLRASRTTSSSPPASSKSFPRLSTAIVDLP